MAWNPGLSANARKPKPLAASAIMMNPRNASRASKRRSGGGGGGGGITGFATYGAVSTAGMARVYHRRYGLFWLSSPERPSGGCESFFSSAAIRRQQRQRQWLAQRR